MCHNIFFNCIMNSNKAHNYSGSSRAFAGVNPLVTHRQDRRRQLPPVFILLPAILLLFCASCSKMPSPGDIEQMNDRRPPVFYIEEPANGDVYGDTVRIRGSVIDDEERENQVQSISSASYYIDESGLGIEIPMEDDGTFVVSFSTHYCVGNITVILEAIDFSGNTGITLIELLDGPAPTDEPEVTPEPAATPETIPTPDPTEIPGQTTYPPGRLWFEPQSVNIAPGETFTTEVHVNSGSQKIAAYGFTIKYNFNVLGNYSSMSVTGVEEGPDGFISATNTSTAGIMVLAGFDFSGAGPGSNMHFLTINWHAYAPGNTYISIIVNDLSDNNGHVVGEPSGMDCMVTISDIIP